jgi:hypothetical protein
MKTINLLPNAEGSIQQWNISPSGTAFHWDKVDDLVGSPDLDLTYIWTNINEKIEEFNHETVELLEGDIINSISLTVVARKTNLADDMGIELGLKIKETRYHTYTGLPLTNRYVNYTANWNVDPSTNLPWTPNTIENLQSSIQAIMSNKALSLHAQLRITQVYFTINLETKEA